MDDVQDRSYAKLADSVMDTFISKNQSLALGVVMNNFGSNASNVNKVSEGYKEGLFTLAGHGWNHVSFNGVGFDQQKSWLSLMNTKLQNMFGRPATTFIPPLAPFDGDTLKAMKDLGIRIISSEFQVDRYPIFYSDGTNITDSYGIYHVPATAKFYDYTGGFGTKVPAEEVLAEIDRSIEKYGWAVVVIHPQDFAKIVDGRRTNEVNQNDMEDLGYIIDSQISKNRKITNFAQLVGISPSPLVDKNPPRIKAPADVSIVTTDTTTSVPIGDPIVTDLIDPSPTITNNAPSKGFSRGTTVVNWTATDASGNSAVARQYITITKSADESAPELSITAPKNRIIYGPASGLTLDIAGTAFDPEGSGIKVIDVRSSFDRSFSDATPQKTDWSSWRASISIQKSGDIKIIARAVDYFENVKTVSIPITIVLTDEELAPTALTLDRRLFPDTSIGEPILRVTGRLTETGKDVGIANQTITFTGSGAVNLPDAVTRSDGTFETFGPAGDVDNPPPGWTVRARYTGDIMHYMASQSNMINYFCFSIDPMHICSAVAG